MSSYSLKPAQCLAKDSWAPTQDHSLPTATNGWLLPAMDCRQEATSGRQAGNRKKIQMERLAKENYYPGHFGNFGSDQKARLSSSSGSSVVSRARLGRDDPANSTNQVLGGGRANTRKHQKLRTYGRKYHDQKNATDQYISTGSIQHLLLKCCFGCHLKSYPLSLNKRILNCPMQGGGWCMLCFM